MIQLEPVPDCPVCKATGAIVITEAKDPLYGIPGAWNYRCCDRCQSLWMDPRPPKEAISSLYPENYFTHTDVHQASTIKRSFPLRVWDAVQHAALRRIGYNGEKLEIPLKFLGELLLVFPPIGREATRRVYFLPRLPGGKLLDVGCGNGSFLDQMRTFGWNCEGIEPDPIAAELARRRGLSI